MKLASLLIVLVSCAPAAAGEAALRPVRIMDVATPSPAPFRSVATGALARPLAPTRPSEADRFRRDFLLIRRQSGTVWRILMPRRLPNEAVFDDKTRTAASAGSPAGP